MLRVKISKEAIEFILDFLALIGIVLILTAIFMLGPNE